MSTLKFPYYNGIIDERTLKKIVGVLLRDIPKAKTTTFDKVATKLVQLNILRKDVVNNVTFFVLTSQLDEEGNLRPEYITKMYEIIWGLKYESEIKMYLFEWAKKINLIAWNIGNSSSFNELTEYYGLPIDAWGSSYIEPLFIDNETPSPVFFETIVHRRLETFDIEGFSKRIDKIKFFIEPHFKRKSSDYKTLGIILCHSFTLEAQNLAKKRGFILITTENLFGKSFHKLYQRIKKIAKVPEKSDLIP